MNFINMLLNYCGIVICVYIFSILAYGIIKSTRKTMQQEHRKFNIYAFCALLIASFFIYGTYSRNKQYEESTLEDQYKLGYDEGYYVGYDEGYDVGYDENNLENTNINYLVYENIYDCGIVTLRSILEDVDIEDKEKIISILSDCYTKEGIYGDFIGDSSTRLLHATNGECFSNIDIENMVLFDGSLDYVLSNGYYSKCTCIKEQTEK